jgi:hypothetical protein
VLWRAPNRADHLTDDAGFPDEALSGDAGANHVDQTNDILIAVWSIAAHHEPVEQPIGAGEV